MSESDTVDLIHVSHGRMKRPEAGEKTAEEIVKETLNAFDA